MSMLGLFYLNDVKIIYYFHINKKLNIMITLSIVPNMKDTFINKCKIVVTCLLLDAIYLIPIFDHLLK